jgi:hypothetical protein
MRAQGLVVVVYSTTSTPPQVAEVADGGAGRKYGRPEQQAVPWNQRSARKLPVHKNGSTSNRRVSATRERGPAGRGETACRPFLNATRMEGALVASDGFCRCRRRGPS